MAYNSKLSHRETTAGYSKFTEANVFTFTLGASASSVAVTFTTAFAAAPIIICTPPYQTSFWLTSQSATGFTFNVGTTNAYAQTINCIAIGAL
jgi:hypothetical protein